jgi:hypothetical protein
MPWLGWGTSFLDFDRDGWLDLFVANGHTESDIEQVDQLTTWKQPDLLWRNRGDGTFEPWEEPVLTVPRAARGVAAGDLDDDGDLDLVISNQRAAPVLLENEGAEGHWIGFEVAPIGAVIEVVTAHGTQVREVRAGGSYLSGSDRRLLFGLGSAERVEAVNLRFRGESRSLGALPVDRYHRIDAGGE